MPRLRVMQIIEATGGGSGRHALEALRAFAAADFDLHVVCSTRRSPHFLDDVRAIQAQNLQVAVLPMVRHPDILMDPPSLLKIRALIREWRPDIIYIHCSKAGFLGRVAALGLPGKVIYAPHAPYFLRRNGRFAFPAFFGWLERLFAGRVDLLHAVSEGEAADMVDNGGYTTDRLFILENALDAAAFRAAIGPVGSISPADRPRRFGFIGALREQKAPLLFLEAARIALASGVNARFVLPSSGRQFETCVRFVALHGLEPQVTFVDSRQSLVNVYRSMDIAVLPSLWEGFPYALLEATAFARPVITSDIAVFRKTIGAVEPRLIVPAGNAHALAERMIAWSALPAEELVSAGTSLQRAIADTHGHDEWRRRLVACVRLLADGEEGGPCARPRPMNAQVGAARRSPCRNAPRSSSHSVLR